MPLADLTPAAMQMLESFSRTANRGHLHEADRERWRRFVIQAHRDGSTLDNETLRVWLHEEEKWPDRASRLAAEYHDARQLLKEYDAARR